MHISNDRPGPDVPSWVSNAVFYQIFPDRFASSSRVRKPAHLEPWHSRPTQNGFKGGDLLGVAERLDYIKDLGIDALYFTPIFASASNHRYHTYDYRQVDPLLGGDQAFRTLLDEAHARDIRVVIDGVFNHASRGFWPFHHILENGHKSPYLDWFHIKGWPLNAYHPRKGPNYEAWWGMGALPKLNIGNPEVREYILSAVEHWTRFGIDGWRLDVPEEIADPDFWRSFRSRVRAINPEAYLVGEIWHRADDWLRGDRFDAVMNYPFSRSALGFCAGDKVSRKHRPGGFQLERLSAQTALEQLTQQLSWYHPRVVRAQLNLLDSHDTPRFLTMAKGDYSALHLATALQMTLPGAPCVYYGDEIGMEGGTDPDCRRAFPWEPERWHQPTLAFFKRVIRLRRSQPLLTQGDFLPLESSAGVLTYLRIGNEIEREGAILVVLNARHQDYSVRLALPEGLPEGRIQELLESDAAEPELHRSRQRRLSVKVQLRARTARVLKISGPWD